VSDALAELAVAVDEVYGNIGGLSQVAESDRLTTTERVEI
jgi:hypothetical protein